MAAFGISFPKLTFCRSSTSKADTNTVSTATAPVPTSTTAHRAFSLSIKNIPSQPLHYDISTTTTTQKKKTSSIATILAIDGETKQLPKNLSVFNELQLDDEPADINEKIRRRDTSNDLITPSSSSPMGTIDHRPDIRFLDNVDSKKILHDLKDDEKKAIQERQSNHTFTPPTSSLSNDSSSNDLHLSFSSLSVDLPQLKYAIEKFLIDDVDDPVYQIAEEFPSGCSLFHQDNKENPHTSNMTTSVIKHRQVDNTELHPMHEKNRNDEVSSRPSPASNNMKWYVSELRINRPLIYRTKWTCGQQYGSNRKLSHSVNDLKQIYYLTNHQENGKYKIPTEKTHCTVYSTLSLQNLKNQKQTCHKSDDNIFRNNHLSCTDDNLNNFQSDEDNQYQSSLAIQRTIGQSLNRDDTLIRNESVKKKLFDILNDDELEAACLEDMSQEFEKISLNDSNHRNFPIINSFSSSSDDAIYSSPPNELHLPPPPAAPLPLSSSYNENLSTNIHNTTERFFGRSRLITTSLDKIPMNNNAYDHPSSSSLLRPSYELNRPTWYTSPSPQWRMDDQQLMTSVSKEHSSKNAEHLNGIDPNRFLRTKVTEYDIKENKYTQKYNHLRKDQKHVNYSLVNSSTPLVDDSTTILPIIQDKSSNLLMFI